MALPGRCPWCGSSAVEVYHGIQDRRVVDAVEATYACGTRVSLRRGEEWDDLDPRYREMPRSDRCKEIDPQGLWRYRVRQGGLVG